jgi:hypothetical protein
LFGSIVNPDEASDNLPNFSKVRGLSEHLIELSDTALLLDNKGQFTNEHGSVLIRTETIGDWLRLAAQLDEVKVNAWKFEDGSAAFCGTAADAIDSHSEHYTSQATNLTRFLFVCNGLEEAYRLIDGEYPSLVVRKSIKKSLQKRSSSLRAAQLIDDLLERESSLMEPKDFNHLTSNFISLFKSYIANHAAELSGMDAGAETRKSYALHLVRNLRNHAAHGMFPFGPPQDFGGFEDGEELQQLLRHACRISGLYIQIIFRGFSPGFES